MGVGSAGMETRTGADSAGRARGGRLGVIAFVLAVFSAAFPWIVTLTFGAMGTGGSDYTGVAIVAYLVQVLGMLTALTLGVLAVVYRRGRRWGIAAIVVSILFSQMVISMVFAVVGAVALPG